MVVGNIQPLHLVPRVLVAKLVVGNLAAPSVGKTKNAVPVLNEAVDGPATVRQERQLDTGLKAVRHPALQNESPRRKQRGIYDLIGCINRPKGRGIAPSEIKTV